MNKSIGIIFLVLMVSCKSKSALSEANTNKALSADKIIASHYANNTNFKTLYIKANAHYEDRKQSQKVSVEIKIKKDEMILVSVRFLGITMAKALISPTQVKYYEKLNGEYFEGDYTSLSKWLGTDLDFKKVQNMLIGEALDDLKSGEYSFAIEDKLYKLENNKDINTKKTYYLEADKFLVKKEEVWQPSQDRKVQVEYPTFVQYNQLYLPGSLLIEAVQKGAKTNIDVSYMAVTLNEDISFPYSVPDGYDRININ